MDKRWLEEQKREFHEMDVDGNGLLTREELLVNFLVAFRSDTKLVSFGGLERLRPDESCSYR